jgi:hypothetical protein
MLAGCALLIPLFAANPLKPAVEVEDTVYRYTSADNGAGPMWCYGSTCIVRCGEEVFACGLETVPDTKPLNNCRWSIFTRGNDGWVLRQADPVGLQREPCPIGVFSDGTLLLSTNPTLNPPGKEGGGPASPQILRFARGSLSKPGEAHRPVWQGEPEFTEHSYRGLGVDGPSRELVVVNNLNYDQQHWSFLDMSGKWSNQGIIRYPIRGCYTNVALKNRACHLFAVGDIVEPVEEWRKWKSEKTGRSWDYVFRRLFYAHNPDVAHKQFLSPIEVDNVDATAGALWNRDLWIDSRGDAHLIYAKTTIATREMRDKFFPGAPIVTSLEYCVIRYNKIVIRKTLITAPEKDAPEVPGMARLQSTQDGRLFVVYHATGVDSQGKRFDENRVMEMLPNSECSRPVTIPLKTRFTSFMTATERAGSPPSATLDLFGNGGDPYEIRYARVRLY